jgi:hypothetical protein
VFQSVQILQGKEGFIMRVITIFGWGTILVLMMMVTFGHRELQKGVSSPVTERFRDNGDGTVVDTRTGLIWLKNANCFGRITWYDATTAVANLADGHCGLMDGSSAGDWRLPERFELQTLLDERYDYPALGNATGTAQWTEGEPFSAVQSDPYWSATAYENRPDVAWFVSFSQGYMLYYAYNSYAGKTGTCFVWLVRGGQESISRLLKR